MNARPPKPVILVVDDEPEVFRSVNDLLRLDYRVLTAQTGGEALDLLDKSPEIGVILSDQRMPGMSGIEVLRRAKQIRPGTTRLLFTGYSEISAVIDAINEGNVFRYIEKPWKPDEMLSVIRQAFDQNDLLTEKARLLKELESTNERLVRTDRLKRAFLEVASHELNTPVAVVLGLTEIWKMLQRPSATPEERNWVERINAAGKRLAARTERMFKLIRSEQPANTLERSATDLGELVRKVVSDLAPFLTVRRQSVDLRIDPALGTAEVDAPKLADVLTNLLVNAIKFSPDGGAIRLWAGPDGPDRFRIDVEDQGRGIPLEDRPYLFEPFFTGCDTKNHSTGEYQYNKRGIGLGLCLVKTFVKLHGGEVEYHSTLDQGTKFIVRMPRSEPNRSTINAPSHPNGNLDGLGAASTKALD